MQGHLLCLASHRQNLPIVTAIDHVDQVGVLQFLQRWQLFCQEVFERDQTFFLNHSRFSYSDLVASPLQVHAENGFDRFRFRP